MLEQIYILMLYQPRHVFYFRLDSYEQQVEILLK